MRQQQFKYTYLFGAVCPERGEGVGLLFPYANTDTMKIHLQHIASHIPKGKHAVIVEILSNVVFETSSIPSDFS